MKILLHLLGAGLLLIAGCSKPSAPAKAEAHEPSHAHHAPHGGTLVELGRHQFNLEFVHDPAAGTLTVHMLNAHADDTVRLDARELPVILLDDGVERVLLLLPAANPLANETAGDTSVFSTQADWLKAAPRLEGFLPTVTVRGLRFEQVWFRLPSQTPPR